MSAAHAPGTKAAPGLSGLESQVKTARGGPDTWNPPFCGDLDMRIAADGTWFYLGSPIGRRPLVKLFSSVLRREGCAYFLVTPVEKCGISVDDAPFTAVEMTVTGEGPDRAIQFRTNVDDHLEVSAGNPLRFARGAAGSVRPYVHVRRGLEALIVRSVFYDLVELGTVEDVGGTPWFGVRAGGSFFPVVPEDEAGTLG